MTSQFAPGEIISIIIAWIVLSIGITFSNFLGLLSGVQGNLEVIMAGFIATATGFILHEMGHKYVAIRHGYIAHFRIWVWGIALTIITAIISGGGFIFGAPGAVYITPAAVAYSFGYYSSSYKISDPDQENMIISAAGPGLNLAFALFFFALLIFASPNSFAETVGSLGFAINLGLGSFNMIPFPPLDGYKIFKKNIIIGLAIALPLWAMFFLYFFIL
ncbi:MAG: site-2 protease family protein [Nitrososphaeria archaeon]|jgi:Zn-dependent protease